jgi:transcriptional regulator with XRE-family HTH domain
MGLMSAGAQQLGNRPELAREIATTVGVSRSLVAMWVTGKRDPKPEQRKAIEAAYGIPAKSWDDAAEAKPAPAIPTEPPQASRPAPVSSHVVPAPLPATEAAPEAPTNAPALPAVAGTVLDRARLLLSYLAIPGRSAAEIAQAKEIRASLMLEARIAGELAARQRKLEEHPDFEAFLDKIVVALRTVPGALDALDKAMSEVSS